VVIVAVTGTAGIGKTATVVHWAHRAIDRFPDGQLYVDLRGFHPVAPMPAEEALRYFLDAFQVSPERIPTSLDGQAALYRTLLAGRKMLIILDNAADVDQLLPLLPGSPGCLVAVTSRNQLTGLVAAHGAEPMRLDLLTHTEAQQLLYGYLGQERMLAEPGAASTLIEYCNRLPLALAITAARATVQPKLPLAVLASALAGDTERLDALETGDPATSIRATFALSHRAQSEGARRIFRMLGLHPGVDISLSAAASLAGLSVRRLRPLLAELTDTHLLAEHAPGRYSFHDLLRGYAGELVRARDNDHVRSTATHRLLDHYLHTAYAAALLLDPYRDPIVLPPPLSRVSREELTTREEALAWFIAEYRVLGAAVSLAADHGFDTHAWQLAWALSNLMDIRGYWRCLDALAIHEVALAAAQRIDSLTGQAHSHAGLTVAYTHQGRSEDADSHLSCALDLFGELGASAGSAYVHFVLAWVLGSRDDYDAAISHCRQALDLLQSTGHQARKAQALNGLGWFRSQLGNHREGLENCLEALDLFQTLGDRTGEAATLNSLARLHHDLGNYSLAIACYEKTIELLHELGHRYYEVETLNRLATSQRAAGRHEAASRTWGHARAMLDELDQLQNPDHVQTSQLRTKLALHA
jgi:tetratricopeptide (TPR) repeat protein